MAEVSAEQAKKNAARVDRLGTEKIGHLLWEFGIPAIASMMVNALYNIVDSIFLGRGVGPIGLDTATIAAPLMTIGMGICLLIGNGGNALIAIKLGEGQRRKAEKIVGNTFMLSIVAAILVALCGVFLIDPLLSISGATEETWESAKSFMQIICFGFVFQVIGGSLNNFMRTAGRPVLAFWSMCIGTVACIVFNYLFVMVFQWGVRGSAYATILGQAVTCAAVLWYFIFSERCPFKLHVKNIKPLLRLDGAICALGSASFILQIAMSICMVVVNNLLITYGTGTAIGVVGAQAAFGVVQRVAMFATFPIIGIAVAGQPIFGYNYGARRYDRVKATLRYSIITGMAIGLFFFALVHIIPEAIVSLFGVSDDLMDFTVMCLKVALALVFVASFQIIGSNYFQATGQPKKSIFLSLTRQLLYFIPAIVLMPHILPLLFESITPLDSIIYGMPVADGLAFITAALMLLHEANRINLKVASESAKKSEAVTHDMDSSSILPFRALLKKEG
jgi:putative MATE family efflux protein